MTTTTNPLTPRQLEVLQWISGYIDTHDYAPTYRQVAAAYGWTVNGAATHIRALTRKGCVEHDEYQSRTLRLTTLGRSLVGGVS